MKQPFMGNFYITFGKGHSHRWQGMFLNSECLLLIQAYGQDRARIAADNIFGRGWELILTEEEMKQVLHLYPRGVVNATKTDVRPTTDPDKVARSFLEGMKLPEGCPLVCHDRNHNGDFGGGCGNPLCWKHDARTSPRPWPMRHSNCMCPRGTFEGEPGYPLESTS